jgi:hypothetical protein
VEHRHDASLVVKGQRLAGARIGSRRGDVIDRIARRFAGGGGLLPGAPNVDDRCSDALAIAQEILLGGDDSRSQAKHKDKDDDDRNEDEEEDGDDDAGNKGEPLGQSRKHTTILSLSSIQRSPVQRKLWSVVTNRHQC